MIQITCVSHAFDVWHVAQQVAEADMLIEGLVVAGLGCELCWFLLDALCDPHAAELLGVGDG